MRGKAHPIPNRPSTSTIARCRYQKIEAGPVRVPASQRLNSPGYRCEAEAPRAERIELA